MLIYFETSRDPPTKYRVGFLKGLRSPHPFGNSLCCFCCCHPTKVWHWRGHRRGEQHVECSASPGWSNMQQPDQASQKKEKIVGKIIGKTGNLH